MLLTLSLDRIAWQPCNPAVGGPAKSQLVHEVDALGGWIGKLADKCYLQKRVLNRSKVRWRACHAIAAVTRVPMTDEPCGCAKQRCVPNHRTLGATQPHNG